MMKKIELIARFFIRDGNVEEFKNIAEECVKIVEDKEPDTLQYDWYFSEDEKECAVIEQYSNSDAIMKHLENVGTQLGQLMELAEFKAEIYGNMSEHLKNAVQGLDIKVYSYFSGT